MPTNGAKHGFPVQVQSLPDELVTNVSKFSRMCDAANVCVGYLDRLTAGWEEWPKRDVGHVRQ